MISPNDLNAPPQKKQETLTAIDVKEDVIPIYAQKHTTPPSKLKLGYDVAMLGVILVDLSIIFFDTIVMSSFFVQVAKLIGLTGWLETYKATTHLTFAWIGGLFTLFLIGELVVRWARAIAKKTYYRWFFFPFVHWYEVLGCFPLLRPLRLLRAGIIIKRLHEMGITLIPEKWIKSAKFYGHILLEELSDRVILTAVGNFRHQIKTQGTQSLIDNTLQKNRDELEQVVRILLERELVPKLSLLAQSSFNHQLSTQVGQAVEKALLDTPELRRYLKLIPIAGGLIEGQLLEIGKKVGENVASSVNETLLSKPSLDKLMNEIAVGVANIDTARPELRKLVGNIVEDSLTAFEEQVKIQQWKHTEQLQL